MINLPVGTYPAVAIPESAQFGETPGTHAEFLEILFRVTDGPYKGDEMKRTFWLTPKAEKYSIADLRTCGCTFPGGDITNLVGLGMKDVEIVVQKQKPKDGEVESKYTEIRFINDPNAPRRHVPTIAEDKKQALRDRLRAAILEQKAEAGESIGADDDIPF